MIYLRARYYDPQIGRFTSLDVEEGNISNPLDMNRYVYCLNNSIKYIDPTGEFALTGSLGVALLSKAVPYIVTGVAVIVKVINYANKDDRLKGKPGDVNVDGNKETVIGSDGRATKERHHTDHGNPSKHTNPHDHDIEWGSDGKPKFSPPINYPNKVPNLFGGVKK